MSRRGLTALGLVASALALVGASPAAAAPNGSPCKVSATVALTPAIGPVDDKNFSWTMKGTLASCQSGPTDAAIEVGQIYTDPATGKKYNEPVGHGSTSCHDFASIWGGTTIVRWAGGGITVFASGFENVGPFLGIQGSPPGNAVASVQLQPVNPIDDPIVLSTTVWKNYPWDEAVAIQSASPTDCAVGGMSSATLTGVLGPFALS